MTFDALIEFNMRNIFLEKSWTKCDGKTVPRSLSKESKLSISQDQWSKLLHSLFSLNAKFRAIEIC